eukprot:CAMPEP_0113698760 /NCGR_PEP_ID=MMETSP0038_2-20120614/22899_1 /TAXON_ID=2898 /ORGANISM="Cryptomonas paramecium" /LENGTH=291 /DNA_ID=CAMNT_0000621979 /DNA_START=18 /DNA_END=889 /DNA_ORIENTATION=- /assembly_acc=CAM_ASM_000170
MRAFHVDVQRVPAKNCFVALPAQIVDFLASQQSNLIATLELKWSSHIQRDGVAVGRDTQGAPGLSTRCVLVSWCGGSSLAHDRLEVPASLAECLGLPDGVNVEAIIRADILPCTRVDVEPVSSDDWEIIEIHAEQLEEQLLNQARVVTVGQVLPIWVHTSTLVRVTITAAWAYDAHTLSGLLQRGMEVVVAPKARRRIPAVVPRTITTPTRATVLRLSSLAVLAGGSPTEACCGFVCAATAVALGMESGDRPWLVHISGRGQQGSKGDAAGEAEADTDEGGLVVRLRAHES